MMNRREALVALAEGKKIRSGYLVDPKSYLKMSELGTIIKVEEGYKPQQVTLPDVDFEEYNPTEEVGVVAYISDSAISRLCEEAFDGQFTISSVPGKKASFPVRIMWDQPIAEEETTEEVVTH